MYRACDRRLILGSEGSGVSISLLSFEILGQVGPILAWAEGEHGSRLPIAWNMEAVPFEKRERGWLLNELPTYSHDNVDEIIQAAKTDTIA